MSRIDKLAKRYGEAMRHGGNGERIRALLPLLREMTSELESEPGQTLDWWTLYTNVKEQLGAAMARGVDVLEAVAGSAADVTITDIVQAAEACNQATVYISRRRG